MRRFIGSLLLLVAMASGATAATYRLDADGTGDFATIAEAIAAAATGDSILLAAGLISARATRSSTTAARTSSSPALGRGRRSSTARTVTTPQCGFGTRSPALQFSAT